MFAFAGLCFGLARLTFSTVERAVAARIRGGPRRAGLYGAGMAGLAIAPVVLAGLAQAYVFYVLPQLHWVGLSWRAQGVPPYLSFAFWEWITCAVISIQLVALSLLSRVG